MQTFSPSQGGKCNKKIANVPAVWSLGMTMDLFKSQLVIAGYQTLDGEWKYHSLQDARGSLLAGAWNTTATPGELPPIFHNSFVYKRDLVLVRGNKQPALMLDMDKIGVRNSSWNQVTFIEDTNSTNGFPRSCGLKVDTNTFITFGGKNGDDVQSTVITINMETQEAQINPPMKFARAKHGCALIKDGHRTRRVLITGGTDGSGALVQDEVYDYVLQYSNTTSKHMTIPRYDHTMVLLNETIFAIGGRDASGDYVQLVEKYNPTDGSWENHTENLLSTSTALLSTSLFPHSALDCDVGCRCGKPKDHRIIGGTEAEVSSSPPF